MDIVKAYEENGIRESFIIAAFEEYGNDMGRLVNTEKKREFLSAVRNRRFRALSLIYAAVFGRGNCHCGINHSGTKVEDIC